MPRIVRVVREPAGSSMTIGLSMRWRPETGPSCGRRNWAEKQKLTERADVLESY